jgi:hypothetical protein
MGNATIKQVADFFKTGDPERDRLKAFSDEWKTLDEDSKAQIKAGIGDGSLTY